MLLLWFILLLDEGDMGDGDVELEERMEADGDEAERIVQYRGAEHLAARLPFRPALRFCYHYVVRAGFLDGYRGYVFCRLMAYYEFLSAAKAAEVRGVQGLRPISATCHPTKKPMFTLKTRTSTSLKSAARTSQSN